MSRSKVMYRTCMNCAFVREDPHYPRYVLCARYGWSISRDLARKRTVCIDGWRPKEVSEK